MGLSSIKTWFQDRFDTLGFEEHVNGINTDDIGDIDLDRVYHIRPLTVGGGTINHTDQRTESDVEVKVFFKGGRNASEAVDSAIFEVEQIIKECCNIKNRTSSGLLNVVFQRVDIEPRSIDNDNSVLLTFTFTVIVLIGVEET